MQPYRSVLPDIPDETLGNPEGGGQASEDDLWFLPGPMEEELDYLLPGPLAEPSVA
jgi:hypothetical protein